MKIHSYRFSKTILSKDKVLKIKKNETKIILNLKLLCILISMCDFYPHPFQFIFNLSLI